jgi:hypothetical protein
MNFVKIKIAFSVLCCPPVGLPAKSDSVVRFLIRKAIA